MVYCRSISTIIMNFHLFTGATVDIFKIDHDLQAIAFQTYEMRNTFSVLAYKCT